ncbi:CaiB/BaiF CoA transferase family protein [Solimonas marina]|uniref:CoA transferase n=1 Tax=Solimonas marina TaxID=2714601 RepID=A0A969WAN7_9GAMM|nr:CoA transferase [Solimonas marina]NKF21405.1 CoA transferase [Solimonas marina]
MSALADLRIVELSGHVAAAICGKLLAGFGADLTRIPAPSALAGFDHDADTECWLHGAKRRLTLDFEQAADRAAFESRVAAADVLLEGWGCAVLADLGYDVARLRALNPALILVQITPFGQNGPQRLHRSSDLTLYARAGLMQITGDGRREPLNARLPMAELSAGLHALTATAMALRRREQDGRGATIDLSIVEAAAMNIETHLAEHTALGKLARRNDDEHAMVPWRTYPCADGQAAVVGGPIRRWLRGAALFEAPELLAPELARMDQRIAQRQRTEALMQPWLRRHDKRSIFHAGQAQGMAWGYLASLQDVLDDPQHRARGFFAPRQRADGVAAVLPGAPFHAAAMPWAEPPMPDAPEPDAVVGLAAQTMAAIAPQPVQTPADTPLTDLRVIDMTHDWSGPHAARLMADYGAEVIKIEYPQRLDTMRGGYPARIDTHPRFWQLHRGKRSLTLDLKLDAHRDVLDQLIRDADIVIENARPGVYAALGYGHDRLRTLKPDIVLLSMPAFGSSGPYAQYCGYGGTLEALGGVQTLTAYDNAHLPNRVREVDAINGMFGAAAALLGLLQCERTGHSQAIELSQFETTSWLVGPLFAAAARDGRDPAPIGNRDARYAPQGCYAAGGDDRWLVLSARDDAEWRALAHLVGGAALADDPRYADLAGRQQHHDALDALITVWSRTQEVEAAVERLQAAGVTAALVATAADLVADPQLAARAWWQTVDGLRLPGVPFRIDGVAPAIRHRGPALGADNAALFAATGHHGDEPDLRPERLGTSYQPA